MKSKSIGLTTEDGLDIGAAFSAFAHDLGGPWRGVRKSETPIQAFCGYLSLHAHGCNVPSLPSLSLAGVEKLAGGFAEDRLVPFDALMDKVDRVAAQHGFLYPAMIGVLRWARLHGGPLPPSVFRSALKQHDPDLWAVLNNVGRPAVEITALAAISHFNAEMVLGRPIREPFVETAVDALEMYLDDSGITDIDTTG
jgi:hypothetical protein